MRRIFVLLALTLGALIGAPVAVAQAPPTLTGEFLTSYTPARITGGFCDRDGSSTYTFEMIGTAAGPYPGTFTETGTVTIGPHDEPIPSAPGQFRARILVFEAEFEIFSLLGHVEGTKRMVVPGPNNIGGCLEPGPSGEFAHQTIASDLRYEATITTGDGTWTDRGYTWANFNAYNTQRAPNTSYEFREGFTSDLLTPEPGGGNSQCSDGVDNDGDLLVDYPADPGCESATDDSESPNPPPPPECSDGRDNDGDLLVDYPADPGCESATDDSESPDPTPVPAVVVLTPPTALNVVGTQHTVTAMATTATGTPVPNASIEFTVFGASDAQGSCTTNAQGQCTFTYSGPALPGADLITGCADRDESGTIDVGEPCGEATKIWILPLTTPGQVTGGGWIVKPSPGARVSFGFNAKNEGSGLKGNCNVIDHATRTQIKCLTVDSLVVTGTHATFFGQARVDGVLTNYRIDVDDLGEPGVLDTFKIQTDSGYTAAGKLEGGNIQIHRSS